MNLKLPLDLPIVGRVLPFLSFYIISFKDLVSLYLPAYYTSNALPLLKRENTHLYLWRGSIVTLGSFLPIWSTKTSFLPHLHYIERRCILVHRN